jgi:hypothetical protein
MQVKNKIEKNNDNKLQETNFQEQKKLVEELSVLRRGWFNERVQT